VGRVQPSFLAAGAFGIFVKRGLGEVFIRGGFEQLGEVNDDR
jgi:hypothetical protein